MLLTLHKPHAKMESYKKRTQTRKSVQSHDFYDICSASMQSRTLCHIHRYGPCTDIPCQTATINHLWWSATNTCLGNLTRWRVLNGTKTHFLLVFFAFALFFLAWSARTVRRNQSPIILPLTGCCLTAHTKRMTLSEAKDTTTSTYSPETWSLCSVLLYDLNHNCSASVGLSDSQFNIL